MNDKTVNSVFCAWKTAIKLAWGVHRGCRTYLLQSVLAPGIPSMRVKLLTCFLGFFHSLLSSPSEEVSVVARLAARDVRSSVGSNLAIIRDETKLDPWMLNKTTLSSTMTKIETAEPEDEDKWRISYLVSLHDQRLYHKYTADSQSEDRLSELIDSLVRN